MRHGVSKHCTYSVPSTQEQSNTHWPRPREIHHGDRSYAAGKKRARACSRAPCSALEICPPRAHQGEERRDCLYVRRYEYVVHRTRKESRDRPSDDTARGSLPPLGPRSRAVMWSRRRVTRAERIACQESRMARERRLGACGCGCGHGACSGSGSVQSADDDPRIAGSLSRPLEAGREVAAGRHAWTTPTTRTPCEFCCPDTSHPIGDRSMRPSTSIPGRTRD